ncbi:MAG: ATP-dependent DNA helicase RecG [bacterium]
MMSNKILLKDLTQSIQYLKGVGPKRAKIPELLGLTTVGDILQYYPRIYQDRRHIKPISQLRKGERETIKGVVIGAEQTGRRNILKIMVSDGTGYISLVCFGRPQMRKYLPTGTHIILTGRVNVFRSEIQISDFEYEILKDNEDDLIHTNRIVPLYPLGLGLPQGAQRTMRLIARLALDRYVQDLAEPLPSSILVKYRLPDASSAIKGIHFPDSEEEYKQARSRLVFDEFFYLQLALGMRRQRERQKEGIAYTNQGKLAEVFIRSLPFSLTRAQERVIQEIRRDMGSPTPMNRLLHGDVGSGKTVVAAVAALTAVEDGCQAAVLAPTEILAEQHYFNLSQYFVKAASQFASPGISPSPHLALLTSGLKAREKEETLGQVRSGEVNIIVGTHALIQEGVEFHRLGLVIIDEQHRFGVMQRAALRDKAQLTSTVAPDCLVMTATPIPRTLALTVYGDLDTSVLDELPPGRRQVITKCRSAESLPRIYAFIRDQVKAGRQAYIVYPLIEESEELDLKAATVAYEHLTKEVFPDLRVGLLHGRIRPDEKDEIMQAFYEHRLDVLVATSVIEVGIDVPNASIMMIEEAERFGLAQLHQLRGRVGRSTHPSYCILLTKSQIAEAVNSPHTIPDDDSLAKAVQRISSLVQTNDGFKIAEADLAIRGPGEFFGTRQSGMPELKLANPIQDIKQLQAAREEAFSILENDPTFSNPEHQLLRQVFEHNFKDRLVLSEIS